jgi:dehydrogenase/reductase SDR family protein 4
MGELCAFPNNDFSIGYAIAERLGLEGARVVISSRKQKNVDEAVARLRVSISHGGHSIS